MPIVCLINNKRIIRLLFGQNSEEFRIDLFVEITWTLTHVMMINFCRWMLFLRFNDDRVLRFAKQSWCDYSPFFAIRWLPHSEKEKSSAQSLIKIEAFSLLSWNDNVASWSSLKVTIQDDYPMKLFWLNRFLWSLTYKCFHASRGAEQKNRTKWLPTLTAFDFKP